jgi:hypothetical protein
MIGLVDKIYLGVIISLIMISGILYFHGLSLKDDLEKKTLELAVSNASVQALTTSVDKQNAAIGQVQKDCIVKVEYANKKAAEAVNNRPKRDPKTVQELNEWMQTW